MRKEPKLQFLVDMEERMKPQVEAMQKLRDKVQQILNPQKEIWYPAPSRIVVSPAPYGYAYAPARASSTEILYTRDKELFRAVAGKKFTYALRDNEKTTCNGGFFVWILLSAGMPFRNSPR